jgi:hypothetical protein
MASLLRQGYEGQAERRGYMGLGNRQERPGQRRLKNIRFCETNRIGLGVVFDVTTNLGVSCDDATKKVNPVRLAGKCSHRGVATETSTISDGHDGAPKRIRGKRGPPN